jgi:hypothetical protein
MSATNRGATRSDHDFYATPHDAIDIAIRQIDWSKIGGVCEPCRGDGRILDRMVEKLDGGLVDWHEIRAGRDYLFDSPIPNKYDLIITNPPYTLAQEFVEKAYIEARNVLMLLRLNFLGSKRRHEFWKTHTPDYLFILSKRPSFTGNGTDATDYAWFGWGKDFTRKPGIYFEL